MNFMNSMTTSQQSQHQMTSARLADRDLAWLVLSELKRVALEYTNAAMESDNPHVRSMFQRMIERTCEHHNALSRSVSTQGLTYREQHARQEDIQQRIVVEQQSGNELHAYVHHHLRYGQVASSATGQPYQQATDSGNGAYQGQDVHQPSMMTGMYQSQPLYGAYSGMPNADPPTYNPHSMNQVQAHQPSTFGFNQEFGRNEAPQQFGYHQGYSAWKSTSIEPMRQYQQSEQLGRETAPPPPAEPPVPGKRTAYNERQIDALSTPGAGVYQSASQDAAAPTTGSGLTSNHTGGEQEPDS